MWFLTNAALLVAQRLEAISRQQQGGVKGYLTSWPIGFLSTTTREEKKKKKS